MLFSSAFAAVLLSSFLGGAEEDELELLLNGLALLPDAGGRCPDDGGFNPEPELLPGVDGRCPGVEKGLVPAPELLPPGVGGRAPLEENAEEPAPELLPGVGGRGLLEPLPDGVPTLPNGSLVEPGRWKG